MFSTLATIAFAPLWLPWKAYLALWWTFDDGIAPPATPATPSAKAAAHAQASSFEVVDSRPARRPLPRPTGALRVGFAGSLALSGFALLVTQLVRAADGLTPPQALAVWLWSTAIASVGSILAVRSVARRAAARGTLRDRARAAATAAAARVHAAGLRAAAAAAPAVQAQGGRALRLAALGCERSRAAAQAARAAWRDARAPKANAPDAA